MHQGLTKFQNEIEKDLKRIKTEWLNRTLFTLVKNSPTPETAPYSSGKFIDTIIVRFDNHAEELNYTNNKSFFYSVTDASADISITSHSPYGHAIEYAGWKKAEPYRPFTKTLRYSQHILTELCDHVFINERVAGTQIKKKMFTYDTTKHPKSTLYGNRKPSKSYNNTNKKRSYIYDNI